MKKGGKGVEGGEEGKKKIERGGSKDPSIDRRGEEETCPRQGMELPSAIFALENEWNAAKKVWRAVNKEISLCGFAYMGENEDIFTRRFLRIFREGKNGCRSENLSAGSSGWKR